MLNDVNVEIAKRAYNAYGSAVSFRNYQGAAMPVWEELPPKIQTAWLAAVASIIVTPGSTNEEPKRTIFQPVGQPAESVGKLQRNVDGDGAVLSGDTWGRESTTTGRPDVQTLREDGVESSRPDGLETIGGELSECDGFCPLSGNV